MRSDFKAQATGFTLVEVLVTVVIISVGLLGIAALQTATMRDNRAALVRGQATALADDILDHMRANRNHAADYVVALGGTITGAGEAATDVNNWQTQLATALPPMGATAKSATGSIAVTPVSGTSNVDVEVTISWGEFVRSEGTDRFTPTGMSFVTRSRL